MLTPGGGRVRFLVQVRIESVQGRLPPDDLNHFRFDLLGELARRLLHRKGSIPLNLNLDQLTRFEGVIERLEECGGDAVMADVHGRAQVMRFGA